MIVLDTHIWIWWLTTDDKRLKKSTIAIPRIGSSSRQRLSTMPS